MHRFKLKRHNAPTRLAFFDVEPSWEDLASKITKIFNIPSNRVHVAFIDKVKDVVWLTNEQELHRFYNFNQSSEEIKFVVQDKDSPDTTTTIASTWSADSNFSDLSKSDDELSLLCWVFNTSNILFSVNIGKDKLVDNLKEAIKKNMEHALAGIDFYTLTLWKLSPPIHSSEIGDRLRQVQSPEEITDSIVLNPVDELSEHFSSPPRKHIHIVVQLPPTRGQKRNITLTEQTVGIQRINDRIQEQLESLRVVVEAFLKNPEPPTWVPPDNATLSNREFLASLQIPSYCNGNPSLLFHNLHVCDGNEIKNIFEDAQHLCICNTSGSGKTRRMLEGLTKYWGFYFVATQDVNGVGIRDIEDILNGVTKYDEWISDLSRLSFQERAAQSELNSQIVSKLLKKVLAARLVVFQLFLEVAIQVDGGLEEKHKRIWLLFQLSEQLDPKMGTWHPFLQIMERLQHASTEDLDTLIFERFDAISSIYLPWSRFIVGLDDAQQAVRLYPNSFVSSTNTKVLRSILHEIVNVFTKLPIKLVVSGTGLSLGDLEKSMASGVSKPLGSVRLFHELGMFDTWPKLKPFFDRYVPVSFSETPSGRRLEQRIQEYLLGRYRFSVSFLEYFLKNGLQSPHKLLNQYINRHTTCLPGDSGFPFTAKEPELCITARVMGFEWNRLQNDLPALQEAAEIVKSHLTRKPCLTFGFVTARLVEYGIARLRVVLGEHKGQIVEPLAFLSLMKWLEGQSTVNLQIKLQSRLAIQDLHGTAYEELVILYLLRVLRYPIPFSTIFQFHGTPPRWADESAQIIGRLDGTAVAVDVLGDAPQNPGLGVVHYAEGIKDVLEWIENPTTSPAVLVPDKLFGPDIMVWCGDVLLMGQLKSYTEGNKESLDAKTISYALTSLHPDHWFKQSSPNLRQKLIDAIKRHHVLRFMGGYPLPPNLNLGGNSVRNAITALGPDVVLATINLDAFRAHFIAEDQARDVLGPMEHALARKRKTDEMDR